MAIKNKTDKLSNNNYLIVLMLVSLLVLGITAFFSKAMISGILRDTKVLSAKNTANKTLDKDLVSSSTLVSNYQNQVTNKTIISDALPNTSDFPSYMAMLENLSAAAGVSLKSIAPSQSSLLVKPISVVAPHSSSSKTSSADASAVSVAPPKPKTLAVNLTFDASYPSLGKLLKNIEQSARPIHVSSIQIGGSGGSLSVQMNTTTYYQDKATLPFSSETVK